VLTIANGGHRARWVHDDYAGQLAAVVAWVRTCTPA
jgi:hypothetical protein